MAEIDQYLTGNMDKHERHRFEERLSHEPRLQAEVLVREGLLQLRLQRKVDEAATARSQFNGRRKKWQFLSGSVLLGLACLAVFLMVGKNPSIETPVSKPSVPAPTEQLAPNPSPQQPTEEQAQLPVLPENTAATPKSKKQIAQVEPTNDLPLPQYPSPNVRGQNSDDKAWKALLDKVWYTDFPPTNTKFNDRFLPTVALLTKRDFTNAFVALKMEERKLPANDTLSFLKGYCLLEMGEGTDALRSFEGLALKQPEWSAQLDWYRALALLLTGEVKKALPVFQKIADTPAHPYRKQGRKALALLK